MQRITILLVVALLFSSTGFAQEQTDAKKQDSQKILMIGNSYTAQTWKALKALFAADDSIQVSLTVHAPGGRMLHHHAANPKVKKMLTGDKKWDVIVLQDQSVDVFCASFSTPYNSALIVYGGQYGNGATGSDAWVNELRLQTDKTLAFIRSRAGSRPIVVLSLDEASVFSEVDGEVLVNKSLGAPMFEEWNQDFDLLIS